MLQNADLTALHKIMSQLGIDARRANTALAQSSGDQRNQALQEAAHAVRAQRENILAANIEDVADGKQKGLSESMLDRLMLNEERIEAIATGLEAIAALPDPLGRVIAEWDRPNGLKIQRVRTPLGVIGVIYESRPNVTADAGALCLKSGNAVILRGGSESYHSSRALHQCLIEGLRKANLPEASISLVPTKDRAAVGALLSGLEGNLDVVVPRGGKSLVARVQSEARVPVIGHLDGLCHLYVDHAAEQTKAIDIVVNAKMRRTGVCGSAETLLVDQKIAAQFIPAAVEALDRAGCALRGDAQSMALESRITAATEEDWLTEYLAPILSIKIVEGVTGAIAHISQYSSGHTESIITEDQATADQFLAQVDSAIVMHNASTQFADGGEFGMGAEIGIATGRIHARGPVGTEQLTTFKYVVRGDGQTRP